MPAERKPGMDHDLYRFSPIGARPAFAWPGGARLALWPVLFLEAWEVAPPESSHRDPGYRGEFGSFFPDYRTYSTREYGNRVGLFRVLEVLERLSLPVTVAAGAAVLRDCPRLVQAIRERGYEVAAHGSYATRLLTSRMTADEERAFLADSLAAVAEATGARSRGWLGQDYGESHRTPHLLAELGCDWLADWPNDDRPYPMTTAKPLLSLPYHAEWDDALLFVLRRLPAWHWPDLVERAARRLLAEAAAGGGRSMSIGIHPWVFGQPHRIRYLEEGLRRILALAGVWPATASAIADAYRARVSDEGA